MSVPDYQSFMFPFLKSLEDRNEQKAADIIEQLATQFNLTEEERQELLPSGRQTTLSNRVGWAKTYMKKAGLLQNNGRARFVITERGVELLNLNPTKINIKTLEQFPEFIEFRGGIVNELGGNSLEANDQDNTNSTPERNIRKKLPNFKR